jgi:xanthine dehydrogenase accessory factor
MSALAEPEAARVAFVQATVVRAQAPSSAHAGDRAVVRGDGSIHGFVGGVCAEESVRLHALHVLETGEPLLLRILPGMEGAEVGEGYVTVANPCLSGGGLEIFLAPHLPTPRLAVVGDTPIGHALADVAGRAGFDVVAAVDGWEPAGDEAAVVVASHGRGEERVLDAALAVGVPYVGLVASPRRGAAVTAALSADPAHRRALHTPAGIDIGAVTPEEVAISILAEVVATRRAPVTGPPATGTPALAAAPTPAPLAISHVGGSCCGEHGAH